MSNEGHLHYAQLANLAAMARSIFHQVGETEVAQPELTTTNTERIRQPMTEPTSWIMRRR
jgi:hypothetical protein